MICCEHNGINKANTILYWPKVHKSVFVCISYFKLDVEHVIYGGRQVTTSFNLLFTFFFLPSPNSYLKYAQKFTEIIAPLLV